MLIGAPKLLAKGTSMKLRSIALVLTIALASAAAHAQSGVYLTFNAQEFSQTGIYANPANTLSGPHGNVDNPWIYGPGYGVYYDVTRLPSILFLKGGPLKTGPVVVGIDLRGETLRLSEYNSTLNRQDGIFSLRIAAKTPMMKFTPYVQGGFGIGHTKVPFATYYSNNLIYQFGVGVDRKIAKHIDWRVEGTGGFLGNYTVGAGAGQSNYMITVDTGVVFRIR
jgi:hypothetical protein